MNRNTPTEKISDEMIMAYVDGELNEEQAARIRKALETDPVLQEKADLFQDTTFMLQGIYDAPLQEEVPERLLKSVRAYKPETLSGRIRIFFRNCIHIPVMQSVYASAFVVVVIMGVGLIYYFSSTYSPGNNAYPAFIVSEDFNRGLEKTPSGQPVVLKQSGVQVLPIATFQDKDLHFCRQFEVVSNTGEERTFFQGIACRNPEGIWKTVAFIEVPANTRPEPDNSSYELAGAAEPINEVLDKLRAAPPLTAQQEFELIGQGWKVE